LFNELLRDIKIVLAFDDECEQQLQIGAGTGAGTGTGTGSPGEFRGLGLSGDKVDHTGVVASTRPARTQSEEDIDILRPPPVDLGAVLHRYLVISPGSTDNNATKPGGSDNNGDTNANANANANADSGSVIVDPSTSISTSSYIYSTNRRHRITSCRA
jgi:hypothetical protein